MTIEEKLDQVRELIQQSDFLEGRGLSNEVNIRMFCYDARDEMAIRHFVEQIATDTSLNCNLKIYNLYEVFLSICEDLDILDAISDMEEEDGSEFLLEQLHSAIGAREFVDKMQYGPHCKGDVLVIYGVGSVFPFMRMHSLLETLQPYFSDIPILVMYPGTFDRYRIRLFDELKPNDYYRALNVVEGD